MGGQCVSVEKHIKRVLILKLVLDTGLLNVLTVYAFHSGKPEEAKESFWNEVFRLMICIPQNEMVVSAGDTNGHVRSSNVGYDGTHGGFGYRDRNADGSKILELADGLNLVICKTLFMKLESQIVLLKVWLIILLCNRRTKQRFVMSRSFQMKTVNPVHKA